MDLVYAAGLFDYLPDSLARRLTRRMFEMLRPDGRLLLANFAPDSAGREYMEAFMHWNLIYRDEDEVEALAVGLPAERISARRVFRDFAGNIVYLDIRRSS